MNRLTQFAALSIAICLAPPAPGQDTLFKSETKLVEIFATVFDHGGRAVDGLRREQFEVRDDGTPQPLQLFESSETPLTCALLLDTTGSMADVMPTLRNAAREFIGQLREKDRIGVYAFSDHVDELAELSDDKTAARRALTRLHAGGRTALFDAISQVALNLEKLPGKKAIVVLTDGGDNASILTAESAVNRARKTGVPVFAVAQGDALKESTSANLLRELAHGTGGHMYKAAQPKDIDSVFDSIAGDLQSGYLLGFYPSASKANAADGWHELQVLVSNTAKPTTVRARSGYSTD